MVALSYAEIARIEERRQAEGTRDVADESQPLAGGWMCFAGKGSWANQAIGLGLDGPVTDADLDRLAGFYRERGVEPSVAVCPFAHESLVQGLAARGFVLRGFENVLARELHPGEDLAGGMPRGWPEGIEIVRVDPDDAEQVLAFCEVSTSGFRPAGQALDEASLKMTRRIVSHASCACFLALSDGQPVGGGSMDAGKQAAGLFGTSVLPDFRRRGIQAALIVRRLEHARALGLKLAIIDSRPGVATERNARKLGFYMAYTRAKLAMPGDAALPDGS